MIDHGEKHPLPDPKHAATARISRHRHEGISYPSWAYATATAACVGLITVYLVRALRSTALGIAFGAVLAALYAMLYALLQSEDYALLGGTLLLFALLAAVMLATRCVDWYTLARPA